VVISAIDLALLLHVIVILLSFILIHCSFILFYFIMSDNMLSLICLAFTGTLNQLHFTLVFIFTSFHTVWYFGFFILLFFMNMLACKQFFLQYTGWCKWIKQILSYFNNQIQSNLFRCKVIQLQSQQDDVIVQCNKYRGSRSLVDCGFFSQF
jgi:hypothetical protein